LRSALPPGNGERQLQWPADGLTTSSVIYNLCVAKSSGAAVMALQTYLNKNFGEKAFETVLGRMKPDDALALRGIILPVNWYPTQSFVRALETAHATFGENDFYEKYGYAAADFEITAFQKFLLKLTSPAFLMTRAGKVWNRFHDTGEWEIQGSGKNVDAYLRNFGVVSAGYCRMLTEWMRRAGQLTGSKGGNVEHTKCRARGDEDCLFRAWWT
jgi:hypothetical protein